MQLITLSIIGNNILKSILEEVKDLYNIKILFYKNLSSFLSKVKNNQQNPNILILEHLNESVFYQDINKIKYPIICLFKTEKELKNFKKIRKNIFEIMVMPFRLSNFLDKIHICIAKIKFAENSLIRIFNFQLDINQREISRGEKVLQLTEKEVQFILYLHKDKKPKSISSILKNVWRHNSVLETHTVETHVHRLRKKFLEVFDNKNFIKNNNKGYFINRE